MHFTCCMSLKSFIVDKLKATQAENHMKLLRFDLLINMSKIKWLYNENESRFSLINIAMRQICWKEYSVNTPKCYKMFSNFVYPMKTFETHVLSPFYILRSSYQKLMVRKEVSENDRKNTPQLYHAQPPSHPKCFIWSNYVCVLMRLLVYCMVFSAINHLHIAITMNKVELCDSNWFC